MMNAIETLKATHGVLRAARGVGVRFNLDEDSLVLEANSAPPPTIIDKLNLHKSEIIASFKPTPAVLTDEDWPVYFHKRLLVAEVIQEMSTEEAQTEAFKWCVIAWLNQHVETFGSNQCAWCKQPDQPTHIVVPIGIHLRGHTWLHPGCWWEWHKFRWSKAVHALIRNGIEIPQSKHPQNAEETVKNKGINI